MNAGLSDGGVGSLELPRFVFWLLVKVRDVSVNHSAGPITKADFGEEKKII